MNTLLLKLYIKFQDLASREEGQDMVEYALVTALLGFGWVVGIKSVATALNNAFQGVSTTLGSYVS
jgi:pilus assembly protein Flp/PilA